LPSWILSLCLLFLCYNPLFSLQLLFLPFFIHSLPLTSPPPFFLPPTCHHIISTSSLHIYHMLISLLCQLYTLPRLLKSLTQTPSTTTAELHIP
jgi:hypothetical protein